VTVKPYDIHAPRYVRAGECLRCGKCCVAEECEHLTTVDGVATCAIHDDPARPLCCVLFPEVPPLPYDGCGFYFLDRWDDNAVVRRHL